MSQEWKVDAPSSDVPSHSVEAAYSAILRGAEAATVPTWKSSSDWSEKTGSGAGGVWELQQASAIPGCEWTTHVDQDV